MSFVGSNILAGASGQGGGGYQIERSLRFNSGDSAYLNRTPSSASNQKTWTWSGWVKLTNLTAQSFIFAAGSSPYVQIYTTSASIFIQTNQGYLATAQVFRDPSAWQHWVFAFDTTQATASNRIKFYVNGSEVTTWTTDQRANITQNVDTAVNSAVNHAIGKQLTGSAYSNFLLTEINFIDGQALAPTDFGETDDNGVWQAKDTSDLTFGTNGFRLQFADNSSNAALGTDTSGVSPANTWTVNNLTASSNNLEISASEVTNHNSVSNYLNVFDGDITTTTSGGDNAYITWTPATNISVSKFEAYFDNSLPGYQIVIAVAGGSTQTIAIASSEGWKEFTSLSGDTIGPNNAVTFNTLRPNGTNCGLHDLNAIRINNKIVTTNSSGPDIDSLVDTPTNGTQIDTGAGGEITGNYAVLNPLDRQSTNGTLSNGNLDLTWATATWVIYRATMHVSSGKWYWEVTLGNNQYSIFGIIPTNYAMSTSNNYWIAQVPNAYCFYPYTGNKYDNTSSSSYATADTSASGTVYGMALDLDAGTMTYYKNGVSLGTAFTGISGSFAPAAGLYNQSGNDSYNFGQRTFAYPLSGYKSLNTANLSSTIADGSLYFDTKLFNANNGTQTVSGYNFSPDLIWTKSRANTYAHQLWDQVRGANKALMPNETSVEANLSNSLAFTSDGFTSSTNNNANYGSGGSVAWAWDAADSNTTIAAGSIHSAATNSAQTWSSNITTTGNSGSWYSSYPATHIFDATTTNYGHANGDGSVAAVVTLSFSPAITCNSSVSFFGGLTGSGTGTISINGGTAFNLTTGSSATTKTTVAFSGSISSIVVTKTATGGEGLLVYGFEIDGIRLTDNTAFTVPAVPSIASTVRANPSAGFSIVSWSSASNAVTVGHGLNAAPKIYIVKDRNNADGWVAVTTLLTNTTDYLYLNTTAAAANFGVDAPTSSTFIPSQSTNSNYVAYCFAPVEGYSAMGSYQGNGNASGPFVYTGFKPAWILYKRSDASGNDWTILDSTRGPSNVIDEYLQASNSNAEATSTMFDFLSNGFKPRLTSAGHNASGGTYIYLAFAEHPFKTARAR